MAEPRYMISKSDDGTYVAKVYDGEVETYLVVTGFQTEQEALAWVARQRRKCDHHARRRQLRDE